MVHCWQSTGQSFGLAFIAPPQKTKNKTKQNKKTNPYIGTAM